MTATGGQRRLSQIRDDFRDITECSVCRETFDDPRTLPCIHTFCRKCLEATASKPGNNKSPESQVLPCPLCRQEFDVPANGGVAGLQKNFFMVRLIDMTKQQHAAAASSVHPSVQLCDVCPPPAAEGNGDGDVGKAEQGVPSAVLFCRNCTLRLCDRCVLHHRRSRLTSAHDLVPPPSPADGKCYSSLRPDECEKHDGERLKLHCTDCQTVVCAFCFIEQHQGHRWSEVEKAADEFRRRIETNVADLAEHSSNLRSKRQELEGVKTDADLKLSDLEKRIHDRRALIVHVVGKHAMSLVAELGTKRQAKLKEIQLEQETIELQLANQASYADYCRELTAKGSAVDVCRAVKDLDSRSDDLQRMCRSLCRRTVEPVALKCNMPTIVGDFMKNKDKNFIGEIVKGYDSL